MSVTPYPSLDEAPELLTWSEAAAMSRRSRQSLDMLRHSGRGPRARKVEGRLLVHRDDLAAWLAGDSERTGSVA